jgi:hypothetical protein
MEHVSTVPVITATNPLPTQILPSPVEMEHVSTSPDIATNPDSTVHITLLDHQIAI